jgi:4-hydroxybenzoate polyprenyltransferase
MASHANTMHWPSAAIQLPLLAIATLTLPIAWIVPGELWLPSICIAALGLAGIATATAWTLKRDDDEANVNFWDFAGVLALIGFGAGMLSDPQAVVQLVAGRNL